MKGGWVEESSIGNPCWLRRQLLIRNRFLYFGAIAPSTQEHRRSPFEPSASSPRLMIGEETPAEPPSPPPPARSPLSGLLHLIPLGRKHYRAEPLPPDYTHHPTDGYSPNWWKQHSRRNKAIALLWCPGSHGDRYGLNLIHRWRHICWPCLRCCF